MFMLKERRDAAGLSQEKLAEKSGVSRGTIAAIESENVNPDVRSSTLLKLAEALNCKVEDIFCA
jgi:DNA-binding XRE family transcriptional regulator